MLQLGRKSRIFAIRHSTKVVANMAVIRFDKTASRLTAIFLPRCMFTYLLSGANILSLVQMWCKCGINLILIKIKVV